MEYPNFKVCCRCFTFNHSKYITDTMNGFTMQQTSFPFVCTIVDDASTDGEQDVIRKYVEENFDFLEDSVAYHKETDCAYITYAQHKANKNCFFAVLFLKENLYSQKQSHKKFDYISEWRDICEYEAMCEGDDYWIDSCKLQKQVDILDSDVNIGVCYTRARIFLQEKQSFSRHIGGAPFLGFKSQLLSEPIMTLTTLYRLDLYKKYNEEINPSTKGWLMGDTPMWLWYSQNSKIHYLEDITSCYRFLENSASHSSDYYKIQRYNLSLLDIQIYFIQKYCPEDITIIKKITNDYYQRNMTQALMTKQYGLYFKNLSLSGDKSIKSIIRLIYYMLFK